LDQYGERYDADAAVLTKAVGTAEGIPPVAMAAFYRAGLPVDEARQALALKCFRDNSCDTGTGGELTVALADGFGENFWRQMTKMEFILQALTYPEIGRIIYITAGGDTQKSISDFRSLVAQDVDAIVFFPDAMRPMRSCLRCAMLPNKASRPFPTRTARSASRARTIRLLLRRMSANWASSLPRP
jgi:hypothetical protein